MSTPTLEARWFVRGPVPAPVTAWADAAGLGAPEARTDRYLVAPTDALGLKVRGGRVEAKERTGPAAPFRSGHAAGTAEPWRKWAFLLAPRRGSRAAALAAATAAAVPGGFAGETDGWVDVGKRRRLRRDACTDGAVCTVELTEVDVGGDVWWSVCFEATGPDAGARQAALGTSAARWLGRADAPTLRAADAAGYPAWLRQAVPTDADGAAALRTAEAGTHGGAAPEGTAPPGAREGRG